jgi:hypothetical protein
MSTRRIMYLVAAAAGAVVVGLAGSAIAAGNTSSPTSFMQSLAKHLGISTEKLQDAAKAAAIDQIDAALADGKITKEQADAAKERIQSGDAPLLFFGPRFRDGGPGFGFRHGPGFGFGGPGPGFGFHHFGEPGAAAADYLGLTEAQLHEQLSSGKSLAQIAKDKGKSTDGLKKALHDAAKKDLDAAVDAGRITQAQADEALDRFDERADDLINRTPGEHPRLERMPADARVLIF